MVPRSFIRGISALAVLAITILIVSITRDSAARSTRITESTFVPLVDRAPLEAKDVSKVEVALPDGEMRWNYKRIEGFWRVPEFANVFAMNDEVDNLVTLLLQTTLRPIGRLPEDSAHYGLLPNSVLTLTLFQNTNALVRVQIGGLAPGAAKDERYVLRDREQDVYILSANPSVFFADGAQPAMLDKHILPRALPHGTPERISFGGSRVSDLRQLIIKEKPVDPTKFEDTRSPSQDKVAPSKKRELTHEFFGIAATGTSKLLDEDEAMTYLNRTLDLEFDKIVGSISPARLEYRNFDAPLIEVTFHYKDGTTVTLAVSGSLIEEKYPVLNKSTSQMFIISAEKLDTLVPKIRAKSTQ